MATNGVGKYDLTVTTAGDEVTLGTGYTSSRIASIVIDSTPVVIYTVDSLLLPMELYGRAPAGSPATSPSQSPSTSPSLSPSANAPSPVIAAAPSVLSPPCPRLLSHQMDLRKELLWDPRHRRRIVSPVVPSSAWKRRHCSKQCWQCPLPLLSLFSCPRSSFRTRFILFFFFIWSTVFKFFNLGVN